MTPRRPHMASVATATQGSARFPGRLEKLSRRGLVPRRHHCTLMKSQACDAGIDELADGRKCGRAVLAALPRTKTLRVTPGRPRNSTGQPNREMEIAARPNR